MRKLAQKKNSFPQDAETCPEKKRLSARCENLPREKTAFRKLRKLGVILNENLFRLMKSDERMLFFIRAEGLIHRSSGAK
jgi:hypothetical protein